MEDLTKDNKVTWLAANIIVYEQIFRKKTIS